MHIFALSACLALITSPLLAHAQAESEPSCRSARYMREDIQKMKRHDRILVDRFRDLNPKLPQAMVNEVNDAVAITYVALSKLPQISSLAKQVRENPVNQTLFQRFQYELMRAVPQALQAHAFRLQERNCFMQYKGCNPGFSSLIFEEQFLQQVLNGQIGNGLYYSDIRRLTSNYFGKPLIEMPKPSTTGLVVNAEFRNYSEDYRDDRRPTEIEFFYYYNGMREETTLPRTMVNGDLEVAKISYQVQYYTPSVMLDVETGSIRHVAMPRKDYIALNPARSDLGVARIVSSYMHQRWQLSRSLAEIEAEKVCPPQSR